MDKIGKDFEIHLRKIKRSLPTAPVQGLSPSPHLLNLGFYLITPLLFGTVFGILADRVLSTKPTGILVGIIFGTVATFYNLFTITKQK